MSDPERDRRVRMNLERQTLARYLPGCEIWGTAAQDFYVDYTFEATEPDGVFRLRVHAPPQFPCAIPRMYVMDPKILLMYGGATQLNQLPGLSHAYHTAGTSPDGRVAICHHKDWNASITLFEVFRKGFTWLKYFSRHLQTGKTIDELMKLDPPETQETIRETPV